MFLSDPSNAPLLEETPAMLLTLLAKDYKLLQVNEWGGGGGEEDRLGRKRRGEACRRQATE